MAITFAFDTRFLCDDKKLYFRKGVWNTIDGIIEKSKIDNLDLFLEKMLYMQQGQSIDNNELENFSENDKKHFNDLLAMDFIIDAKEYNHNDAIKILTGQEYKSEEQNNQFSLITDCSYIEKKIEELKEIYKFNCNVIDKMTINELSTVNLFSKINYMDYESKIDLYNKKFKNYPILVLLNKPDITLLRNLNYIASKEKPLFIGFIDGPFMIFLGILPKVTACWECFEQRMLAFLKDHILYNKFLNVKNNSDQTNVFNLHLTNLLTCGLQEVFTWNQINMSKLMGRAMFTYLPTYEIHFHDINRISSCNYCGYISREECKNSNISLAHVLDEFITEKDCRK